ncbi:MAG: translation initiation factor IF-2 [Patescibacteria group bacterium]
MLVTTPIINALVTRPPIVVVMGHIDHGKTTLLDRIRSANVAAREAGGITQHIGAYGVERAGKRITFIDTPGHEAFSKMRERGARVADVAILVVAADDGIKPQTLEALAAIKTANIPYIIALNKIDKPGANPDTVKTQLSEHEVFIEEWGGTVPLVAVSAKQGLHIEELLDMILLVAEMQELTADPSAQSTGVVIESHRDARRGNTATLLVRNGTLKVGDYVSAGDALTRVRIMESYRGDTVVSADPGTPVQVVGFDDVPVVGTAFQSCRTKTEAEDICAIAERMQKRGAVVGTASHDDISIIPILVKADADGSREVLEDAFAKLSFGSTQLKIVDTGVGDITEGDVKAVATDRSDTIGAMILGFNVKITADARFSAERFNVQVATFPIIYDALEWVEKTAKEMTPKKMRRVNKGVLEILKIFAEEKGSMVIGGKVIEGVVNKGDKFEAMHRGRIIGKGGVKTLQKDKVAVDTVGEGSLCGLSISSVDHLEKSDTLQLYAEEVVE